MLVSLLFIGLYYFIYFKAQTVISDLVANAVVYGVKIKGSGLPAVSVRPMSAPATGTAMALVSRRGARPAAALTWAAAFAAASCDIATASGSIGARPLPGEGREHADLPDAALLGKEFGRVHRQSPTTC